MSTPDVSFLVTAYQPRRDWLLQSLRSLLTQSGVELEIVLVDDGSPTPVDELLEGLDGDSRLRLIRSDHLGLSGARNLALSHARGTYIRYFDSDDVAERQSTARLLALAGPETASYGATAICDPQLRVRWVMRARQQGTVQEEGLLDRFPVRPVSMVLPRKIAEQAGPWDEKAKILCDWDFLQRVFERCRVRGDPEVATYYRRHASSLTAEYEIGLETAGLIVDRYFARHPECQGTALERRAGAMLDARAARVYVTHGAPQKALRPFMRALMRSPAALFDQARQGMPALAAAARQARSPARRLRRSPG